MTRSRALVSRQRDELGTKAPAVKTASAATTTTGGRKRRNISFNASASVSGNLGRLATFAVVGYLIYRMME